MVVFKNIVFLCLISFLALGCASKNREIHQKLKTQVKSEKFEEALKTIKSDDFYPDKTSILLKLMEGSITLHLNGDYFQAMNGLDATKELSDQLYTVSISKKLTSALVNDNEDNYYGETYERSMIRFYQAVNHYMLFSKGKYERYTAEEKDEHGKVVSTKEVPAKVLSVKERKFHLSAARSTLIEWNSLLDTYKAESAGKPTYKDDLLAKVFGAFIHEQMGSTNDRAIALNLYKAAKVTLFRSFNLLPTYNKKSEAFAKNFDKFEKMEEKEVEKNFVEKTQHYISLEKFLNEQIARVSQSKKNSVFVLLENNFIADKVVKKFEFPIPVKSLTVSAGGGDFLKFSMSVLKVAESAIPKIYFEMPEIPYAPVEDGHFVNIKDESGKVLAKKELVIVNPLSDLAHYTLNENSISNYAKLGARVATKHVAALVAAYAVYQKSKGTSETMAMLLAGGAYGTANKAIELSERADLRSWALLPHAYSITSFDLAPGKYSVEYEHKGKLKSLGNISIKKEDRPLFIKERLY